MKHVITQTAISRKLVRETDQLFNKHSDLLNKYIELLLWWNKKVNLVSRDVSRETLREHVRHSLLISGTDTFMGAKNIIDAGTGGGLPGLPLALCFPDKEFVLNDIVSKKVLTVKQVVRKLEAVNVDVISGSISEKEITPDDVVVTKHAFKIYELIEFLDDNKWNHLVFLKGSEETMEELSKVDVPISAMITNLKHSELDNIFYKGKAIVEISRVKYE